MKHAQKILQNTFGYSDFRHHQADIIQSLLNGDDALVLMPTGGGKSLCYQIPAMVREGVGIIISPLIALMQDQVDALQQLGIRSAFLNSSMNEAAQSHTEQQLLNNKIDLLYVAPERLMTGRMLSLLERSNLSLFAIDEAHCVSQWGHDFRKEYQQLRILHERFPAVPRIALTATADQRTRQEIIEQLNLHDANVFINSFDRPNINYTISEGQNARDRLWGFLEREHPDDAGIVYCLSRNKVEKTAEWLQKQGRIALPYHAGLSAEVRQEHQRRFLREDGIIIVATIAFGMGIDKPDVRFVAHLSLPKSIEAYYQETGRAGRDGAPANAWMSYGLQDVISLRQMAENNDSSEQFKRILHHKLETMLALCEQRHCRRQSILAYFDEPLHDPCGNCDTCLNPPEQWDATEASRKALSCVHRTGQRFGVNYVIDVLLGKNNARIKQFEHDTLSTYGIGKELHEQEWRSVFRQLMALGYLATDIEGHGAIKLAESSRPLLRGEIELILRKPQLEKSGTNKKSKRRSSLRGVDDALFEQLREHRLELAKGLGVPPYIIFHDSTLEEMAEKRPETLDKMRYISGVGEQKLDKFGESFLRVILSAPLPDILKNNLSDTINDTLALFNDGNDIEAIAKKRGIKDSTVYSHLAEAIEAGLLDAREVLSLSEDDYKEIVVALEMTMDDDGRLKPVYDTLEGKYDYSILKCVQASFIKM
ncbi:MAG: DNA helicase RecQ [Gammaproteobacteria bacterium]|nr:DNA helicase RecQ [Gammaproteobacteria bacterium]